MNRNDHIEWCKQRALLELDQNGITNALASIQSDLSKHDETKNHPCRDIGMILSMTGKLSTYSEMKKFIEDVQ